MCFFAEAPNISYPGTQIYTVDQTISTLKPTNTGGGIALIPLAPGFDQPAGIAVDATDNIYVADVIHSLVYKLPYSNVAYGSPITLASLLAGAYGVAVDGAGNVYAAIFSTNEVKKIPYKDGSYGTPLTLGSGFNGPKGVAVDLSGNVYVADYLNNAVKKIPYSGGTYGSPLTLGSGFSYPAGVAVDGSGNPNPTLTVAYKRAA